MILDLDTGELIDGDLRVQFTRQQTKILAAIAEGHSSYTAMCEYLWPAADGPEDEPRLIKVVVHNIRKRIAKAGMPPVIGTVWGKGFVFGRPVEVRSALPGKNIPNALVPSLRSILYASKAPAADKLLEVIGG